MRKIEKLIIHCSASDLPDQDSIEAVKKLHVSPKSRPITWGRYKTHGKGFSDVGYHYYIDKQGRIFHGRAIHETGAHCRGSNFDSIGICLAGEYLFKDIQFKTLKSLILDLCGQFGLSCEKDVYPHNFFDPGKTCPNFDIPKIEWPERDLSLTGDIEE